MPAACREIQLFVPAPSALYSIDLAAMRLGMSRYAILQCCKYGVVSTASDPAAEGWYFDEEAMHMLRRIGRLLRLCRGNLAAARKIMELEDEVSRLRAELQFWRGLVL